MERTTTPKTATPAAATLYTGTDLRGTTAWLLEADGVILSVGVHDGAEELPRAARHVSAGWPKVKVQAIGRI